MSTDTVPCPFCEAQIGDKAKKCRYCGEWVARRCLSCNTQVKGEWAARGYCHECQVRRTQALAETPPATLTRPDKSRTIGVVLALVLGGVGAHKFYTGRTGRGILYLLFWWTGIPSLVGIFEGVHWATMSDEEFDRRILT